MQYLDPPTEYGIAINFGTSDVGKGEPKVTPVKKAPQKEEVKEEKVEEVVKDVPKEVIKEEVITSDDPKAPVIEKPKEEKKIEEPKKVEPKKEIPKPKPKPKKPSKKTLDAFKNLLEGDKSDGKTKGDGDDETNGDKGKKDGDPESSKYYGNGGKGGDSNYNLSGRNALKKPIEKPDCEEEGTVVVTITVDKSGKVIKAVPGAKGTTNSSKCLMDPAREAALKTTWNADNKAPSTQTGTIIYKFSLTK
jgi:outer membrane biosynthesis protein TonB